MVLMVLMVLTCMSKVSKVSREISYIYIDLEYGRPYNFVFNFSYQSL